MNRLFPSVALVCAVGLLAVCITWIHVHPMGAGWDESGYLNQLVRDRFALLERGPRGLAFDLLYEEGERPPGYRIAATPLILSDALGLKALSLWSLGFFVVAVGLVYRAARYCVAPEAALVATALFGLGLSPVLASIAFGMEYVMYLSIAALFWVLCRAISLGRMDMQTWAGIAIAGLAGGLSKTSFLIVGGPTLLLFLLFIVRRRVEPGRLGWGIALCATALAVMAPWWLVNWKRAADYAAYASGFVRHGFPWPSEFFMSFAGPALSLLVVCLFILSAIGKPGPVLNGQVKGRVLGLALAGSLPLTALHLLGNNHSMRLLTPALIPMALGTGVLVDKAFAAFPRTSRIAATVAVVAQTGFVAQFVMSWQPDQWEWEPLHRIVEERGLVNPRIAHLGNGSSLTPPAIMYPWVVRGQPVDENWLWRYEEGPVDWNVLDAKLEGADVVVTPPGYRGDDEKDQRDLDNRYNDELAKRMEASGRFEAPVKLEMGQARTPLLVYLKRPPTAAHATAGPETAGVVAR